MGEEKAQSCAIACLQQSSKSQPSDAGKKGRAKRGLLRIPDLGKCLIAPFPEEQ
jgi:hypothetical protein